MWFEIGITLMKIYCIYYIILSYIIKRGKQNLFTYLIPFLTSSLCLSGDLATIYYGVFDCESCFFPGS